MTDNNTYHNPTPKPRIYYGYVVVAASFIIMILVQGLYIIFGVFINPLIEEFGWTRATISGAFSLSTILQGVLGIAMGGLMDRFGPRIVVTVCGVLLGAGYLLMSQINTVYEPGVVPDYRNQPARVLLGNSQPGMYQGPVSGA